MIALRREENWTGKKIKNEHRLQAERYLSKNRGGSMVKINILQRKPGKERGKGASNKNPKNRGAPRFGQEGIKGSTEARVGNQPISVKKEEKKKKNDY